MLTQSIVLVLALVAGVLLAIATRRVAASAGSVVRFALVPLAGGVLTFVFC